MAVISLAVLGLSHFASCSGTFYQKVSDSSDDADISTKVFHECSFKNNCKYLGIPVDNAGDKATTAATMQELQVTGEKQQIWKKIELEDSKEDSSDEKGKLISESDKLRALGVNISYLYQFLASLSDTQETATLLANMSKILTC